MDSKNGRRSQKGNKATPVIILKILRENTDENHVIQNADIRRILEEEYGIVVDRKKISDDIQLLREVCDIDIVHNEGGPRAKGYWLRDRAFEAYELRMLIDSVLSNKYLSEKDSYELIQKLADLYGGMFDPHFETIIVLDRKSKTVDRGLYDKIETINEAIETSAGIKMLYNEHRITWKSPSYRKILTPCCMLLKDNRYYLVIDHETEKDESCFEFIPLDDIHEIELTKPQEKYKKAPGEIQKEALRRMVETYLSESIELHPYYFYTTGDMLKEVDDYFGIDSKNVQCKRCKDKYIIEKLTIDRPAMIPYGQYIQKPTIYETKVNTTEELFKQFAKKNINYIKIIKPQSMIDIISSELKHALAMMSE